MYKQIVSFEKREDITVAIRYTKENKNDQSVSFEIVSAVDQSDLYHSDDDYYFNLVDDNGNPVKTFEEACRLAAGKVFLSNNPRDIISGNQADYTIEVKPHVWFRRSYEAMNAIVKGQMREKCMLLIANKDIDEYEFSDGQGV